MASAVERVLGALAPCTLLAGQAGVGKTTLGLSLALDGADAGESVTVIDLDVVNPYYRSSEARSLLEAHGIRLIAPRFSEAGTSLDAPGLTAAIGPALNQALATNDHQTHVIVDLGGEADGARALGRYTAQFEAAADDQFALYGVVNASRPWSAPDEVIATFAAIADACRLSVAGVINNTHLMAETDESTWSHGRTFAAAIADVADVPLVCTTLPVNLAVDPKQLTEASEPSEAELFYPIRTEALHLWPNQAMI